MRDVIDNGGYEAESYAAAMTLQCRGEACSIVANQRQKIISMNTDHEEATQLPMNHYEAPQLRTSRFLRSFYSYRLNFF